MLALSRPGYVYVMANPSLPGWRKVGHTHRPPHRRAQELSRTAVPTAFDVEYARFFWDALAAEQGVHRLLEGQAGPAGRRKEFFNLPLDQARLAVQNLPDAGRASESPLADAEGWETTLEGRESLWEWAEADWRQPDPAVRKNGWRAMERLSAAGWGEGSWRLAEHLMHAAPGQEGAARALWVLDAAAAQGLPEARLRAAWLRSWSGEAAALDAWRAELDRLPGAFGDDWRYWPPRVADTLAAEATLWARQPSRRLDRPWWPPA